MSGIPEAIIERIISCLLGNWTHQAIAEHVGVSASTVQRIATGAGLQRGSGWKPPKGEGKKGAAFDQPELVPPPFRRVVIDMAEVFDEVVQPRLDAYRNGEESPYA